MSSDLNFISYNARVLRQLKNRRQLFSYLHRRKADIIFLQETHSCIDDEVFWKREWGGSISFSHGSNRSRGVCILFNFQPTLYVILVNTLLDQHGRYVICDVKFSIMSSLSLTFMLTTQIDLIFLPTYLDIKIVSLAIPSFSGETSTSYLTLSLIKWEASAIPTSKREKNVFH